MREAFCGTGAVSFTILLQGPNEPLGDGGIEELALVQQGGAKAGTNTALEFG
ncbi:hypothetical protein [Methylobacterium sp. CM6247]